MYWSCRKVSGYLFPIVGDNLQQLQTQLMAIQPILLYFLLYDQSSFGTAWWRHQMKSFSASLAICTGNSPVTGEFLAQRPVTRSFDVFFDLRWINRWVNNDEAGDLRRYRTHYDVIVIVDKMSESLWFVSCRPACKWSTLLWPLSGKWRLIDFSNA